MNTARSELALNYVIVIAFAIVTIFPVVSIFLLALRRPEDIPIGLSLPQPFSLESLAQAWDLGEIGRGLNSFVVASTVAIVSAAVSTLAGYAFGTMTFGGSRALFALVLLGLMFPYEVTLIPLYYGLRTVNLTDTYWALILPQIALSMPFGIFWMRSFFRSCSKSLLEAARLDGASSFRILWDVLVPMARPAITTMMVLFFMWTWNEFLMAVVMIQSDSLRTAPLDLAVFSGAARGHAYPALVGAAALIVAVPIVVVYILLNRAFMRGVLGGSYSQ